MTLTELVTPLLAHTDAEIANTLNAQTVAVTNPTRYTWAGLMLLLGTAKCMELSQHLSEIPNSLPISSSLTNPGIDFSLDETQTMLDQFTPEIGAENALALKRIGRWSVSPYNAAGYEGQITADQVGGVRTAIAAAASRAVVDQWVATVINEILNPRSPNATIEDLKAAIAEAD